MQNANEERIRELLFLLVTGFVDHMQDVRFQIEFSHTGVYVTATFNRADQRRIIGTGGKNVVAIRSVLSAFIEKLGLKLKRFHVMEPTVGQEKDSLHAFEDPDWNVAKTESLSKLVRETIQFIDPAVKVTYNDQTFGETKIRIHPSFDYGAVFVMAIKDIFRANAKARGRSVIFEVADAARAV